MDEHINETELLLPHHVQHAQPNVRTPQAAVWLFCQLMVGLPMLVLPYAAYTLGNVWFLLTIAVVTTFCWTSIIVSFRALTALPLSLAVTGDLQTIISHAFGRVGHLAMTLCGVLDIGVASVTMFIVIADAWEALIHQSLIGLHCYFIAPADPSPPPPAALFGAPPAAFLANTVHGSSLITGAVQSSFQAHLAARVSSHNNAAVPPPPPVLEARPAVEAAFSGIATPLPPHHPAARVGVDPPCDTASRWLSSPIHARVVGVASLALLGVAPLAIARPPGAHVLARMSVFMFVAVAVVSVALLADLFVGTATITPRGGPDSVCAAGDSGAAAVVAALEATTWVRTNATLARSGSLLTPWSFVVPPAATAVACVFAAFSGALWAALPLARDVPIADPPSGVSWWRALLHCQRPSAATLLHHRGVVRLYERAGLPAAAPFLRLVATPALWVAASLYAVVGVCGYIMSACDESGHLADDVCVGPNPNIVVNLLFGHRHRALTVGPLDVGKLFGQLIVLAGCVLALPAVLVPLVDTLEGCLVGVLRWDPSDAAAARRFSGKRTLPELTARAAVVLLVIVPAAAASLLFRNVASPIALSVVCLQIPALVLAPALALIVMGYRQRRPRDPSTQRASSTFGFALGDDLWFTRPLQGHVSRISNGWLATAAAVAVTSIFAILSLGVLMWQDSINPDQCLPIRGGPDIVIP